MKTKLFSLFLALVASVGMMHAETFSGNCGTELTWSLNTEDSTLIITGSGEMTNWDGWENYAPWYEHCSYIAYVSLPDGLLNIGDVAFYSCDHLTSIDIPNSVTSIGGGAFALCEKITSIRIPSSVTSIGYDAFYGCNNITSVTIPNSVNKIGERAFSHCENLGEVNIQNGVDTIGEEAFFSCKKLKTLYLPNSISELGYWAFSDCSIREIHFDGTIEDWCLSWNTEDDKFTADTAYGGYDFYINGKILENLVIPESITSLNICLFQACSSLKSVVIPNNVTTMQEGWMGGLAFENCKNLHSVTLSNALTKIAGRTFDRCINLTSIEIPNSIDTIGEYAFADCSNLKSVTIGQNVTHIESYAFSNCSSLDSLTIPANVIDIGSSTFDNCTGMKTLVIEDGILELGPTNFSNCTGLTSVTSLAAIPPTMKHIRIIAGGYDNTYYVFDNVDCSKIPLYVPDESVEDYKAADQWNWFNPIIPLSQKPQEDEAIGEILSENMTSSTKKILHNGQIYILRGDKTYTLQGQEVK